MEKGLLLEAGLISEERYFKGAGILRPGELKHRTPRVFVGQVTWTDLPAFAKDRAKFDCGRKPILFYWGDWGSDETFRSKSCVRLLMSC
jgi:hypothetical protein